MRTLIEKCRVVSPGSDIPEGYIAIDGETIEYSGAERPAGAFDSVLAAAGLIAVPGFIDIHSHGRSGFDFCDASDEAFETIGRGKLADGVTSFLATTLSVPMDDLRKVCRTAKKYMDSFFAGSKLLGIHLEGPFFNPKCAGAQNPACFRNPDIAAVDELNGICKVLKVTFSPELDRGSAFTLALAERGIMPSGGHSEADYECFEKHRAAGMKHLTHFCNVMTPVHHLRFGMVGGGLLSDDVCVEMICDGVHLCGKMIELIARIKGPQRMMLITDAMRASAMPDGNYSIGGLPVVVSSGKATLTTGVVAGSTLRFHDGLKKLLKETGLPLDEAIRAAGLNQALSLGLQGLGRLEKGYTADIAVLDPELNPVRTICNGATRWIKET